MSKKLTIEEIKQKLESINANLEILSKEYINSNTKLQCKCKIDGFIWGITWNKLQQGKGCPVCAGNQKLGIKNIKKELKDISPNIEIISNTYDNNMFSLQCKCLTCDKEWTTCWSSLQQKHGCSYCAIENNSNKLRLNIQQIKSELLTINKNILIMSEKYYNNSSPLLCKCLIDGYEWTTHWSSLKQGKGCPKCSGNAKLTIKEIKENLKILNPNIIILNNSYNNAHDILRCKCLVDGYEWSTSWSNLSAGHGCKLCFVKNNSGHNCYLWANGLTPIYSYLRKCINEWKIDSFKKYNYRCYLSGLKNNLVIHHLYSFSQIVMETFNQTNIEIKSIINDYTVEELELIKNVCLDLHYKYGLGVCLSSQIHQEFHNMYGYKCNTKEQFNEFIISFNERGLLCG